MVGWLSLTTAAFLLVTCTIREATAQATIPCFTRTGCNDEDSIGNLPSVRDCCGLPNSISYVPAIGAELCVPCRSYGWAQNISSDLSRSEFQISPISAVEGETVSLTLFLFKNIPRSTIIFRLDFLRGGTAVEGTDYTISYTDELNRPDINLIELQGVPIQVNVTLLNDGIGGEGEESIILTLRRNVDLTPVEPFNLLTNNEVIINVGDNEINVRTGFESGEKITVSEGNMTVLLCLSTSGVPSTDTTLTVTTLTVTVTYCTANSSDVNLITPEVNITQTNQEPCVILQAIDDNIGLEGVENLTITLNGPANVEFTNRTIEVCIQDINVVEFGFLAGDGDTAEAEGNEEDENINVVITRSGRTAMDAELTITPVVYNESFGISISPFDPDSPNIATPGQDFPEDVLSVVIPAGEGPITVQIPIINDIVTEDSEQYFIGVLDFADDMPPSGVTLGIHYILLGILEEDNPKPICPTLNNPRNGQIELSGVTEGETAIFTCNNGFKLVGEQVLICGEDGKWNYLLPICQGQRPVTVKFNPTSYIVTEGIDEFAELVIEAIEERDIVTVVDILPVSQSTVDGTDYSVESLVKVLAPGQKEERVRISIIDDSITEETETLSVLLSTEYMDSPSIANITILDNDNDNEGSMGIEILISIILVSVFIFIILITVVIILIVIYKRKSKNTEVVQVPNPVYEELDRDQSARDTLAIHFTGNVAYSSSHQQNRKRIDIKANEAYGCPTALVQINMNKNEAYSTNLQSTQINLNQNEAYNISSH